MRVCARACVRVLIALLAALQHFNGLAALILASDVASTLLQALLLLPLLLLRLLLAVFRYTLESSTMTQPHRTIFSLPLTRGKLGRQPELQVRFESMFL